MYFFITGKYQDENAIEGTENNNFEWVIEAENEMAAIKQLEKGEILVSIREISLGEIIEREERDLLDSIKREYIYKIIKDIPIKEATSKIQEMNNNKEIYYIALKSFNKRQRLNRILKRQKGYGELSMTEYSETLNKLIDSQTEEEFYNVLSKINR